MYHPEQKFARILLSKIKQTRKKKIRKLWTITRKQINSVWKASKIYRSTRHLFASTFTHVRLRNCHNSPSAMIPMTPVTPESSLLPRITKRISENAAFIRANRLLIPRTLTFFRRFHRKSLAPLAAAVARDSERGRLASAFNVFISRWNRSWKVIDRLW